MFIHGCQEHFADRTGQQGDRRTDRGGYIQVLPGLDSIQNGYMVPVLYTQKN